MEQNNYIPALLSLVKVIYIICFNFLKEHDILNVNLTLINKGVIMDRTDLKIIQLLQENARITMKEIGNQVGLTSPAVTERVHRLEDEGVIRGYHAELNPLALGRNVVAFVEVDVPPRNYEKFIEFCEKKNSIVEHHHIIGPYNSMLRVVVHDSGELEELLSEMKVYGNSQTAIVLSSYFHHKKFSEPENRLQ